METCNTQKKERNKCKTNKKERWAWHLDLPSSMHQSRRFRPVSIAALESPFGSRACVTLTMDFFEHVEGSLKGVLEHARSWRVEYGNELSAAASKITRLEQDIHEAKETIKRQEAELSIMSSDRDSLRAEVQGERKRTSEAQEAQAADMKRMRAILHSAVDAILHSAVDAALPAALP